MKYKGYVKTDIVGSKSEFEFEVDDEELEYLTEENITEIAMETMLNNIEWDYKEDEH